MAEINMRQAISDALWEEMERDDKVFIMGEEVGVWGGTYAVTKGFYEHFGEKRVKDTPISEAAIIGAGIGAALVGLRPVSELMTINFAFVAMDHIVNEAPKLRTMFGGQMKVPLVIRTASGGGRRLWAPPSQTPGDNFPHRPGLTVVSPGTPADAKGLLKAAIRDDNPVLYIAHAAMYQVKGEVPDGDYTVPIGVSKVQRPGSDVTIVSYCRGLQLSMQAAPQLAGEGIRAVIVEEGWRSFGVGAEVSSRLYEEAFDYADAPIQRVAQKEVPLPYNRALEQSALPQVADVVAAVKEVL